MEVEINIQHTIFDDRFNKSILKSKESEIFLTMEYI